MPSSTRKPLPANEGDLTAALKLLLPYRSWHLHRVSPTTSSVDLEASMGEQRIPIGFDQLIRAGIAYRCRIGRGPYGYAPTAASAVGKAIEEYERARAKTSQAVAGATGQVREASST